MTSKHTILYAEDDPDDVYMVKKAFEQHDDIHVVHALHGQHALELLNQMLESDLKPCLVILDINMPVMSGKEALKRIRENKNFHEIPVVLFTTSSSPTDKEFAHSMKVDFFTKPIHYQDLETIARQFVDRCNFEVNKISSR